jgi:hypothetical protein
MRYPETEIVATCPALAENFWWWKGPRGCDGSDDNFVTTRNREARDGIEAKGATPPSVMHTW